MTDKGDIPLSAVISSPASQHSYDINLVTDVIDNTVIKKPQSKSISSSSKSRSERRGGGGGGGGRQHLCLDNGYKSAKEEQESIKRGYVLHIPIKKKRKG